MIMAVLYAPDDFQRMAAFNSEPSRLAATFRISPDVIRPYLADADALPDPEGKAYPDDEFPVGDFWVFTDFWRRLGITYPTPGQNLAAILRLGTNVQKKLPTS